MELRGSGAAIGLQILAGDGMAVAVLDLVRGMPDQIQAAVGALWQ